ncbi:MAG TPA: TadE family protein [Candidatus Dormibacteraeota bacterium]
MKRLARLSRLHRSRRPSRRARSERGQAITEFALVFPIAVVILALCATGGQMLVAAIDLTQAARAATVTVVSDVSNNDNQTTEEQDGLDSANGELGQNIQCTGQGDEGRCIAIATPTGGDSGQPLVQVTLWQSITPFVPLFPNITISSQATSAQS